MYRLENASGNTTGRWALTYLSLEQAAEELRLAMGWDEIFLSTPFSDATDCGETERAAWCGYESTHDRDRDDSGAYAPRIVEE